MVMRRATTRLRPRLSIRSSSKSKPTNSPPRKGAPAFSEDSRVQALPTSFEPLYAHLGTQPRVERALETVQLVEQRPAADLQHGETHRDGGRHHERCPRQ